jgi:hypothetical protein
MSALPTPHASVHRRSHLRIVLQPGAREVRIGKNAKGGRPLLTDVLHVEHLVLIQASGERVVEHSTVTGLPEAMIAMARAATGALAFGRLNPVSL